MSRTPTAKLADKLSRARNNGIGLKLNDWSFDAMDLPGPGSVVDALVDWCKKALAECRRPYGVDHFDLAIAYRVGASGVRHHSFRGLRPLSLYQGDLDTQLRSRFKDLAVPGGEALIVSAAVFSWGDALSHALLQV